MLRTIEVVGQIEIPMELAVVAVQDLPIPDPLQVAQDIAALAIEVDLVQVVTQMDQVDRDLVDSRLVVQEEVLECLQEVEVAVPDLLVDQDQADQEEVTSHQAQWTIAKHSSLLR